MAQRPASAAGRRQPGRSRPRSRITLATAPPASRRRSRRPPTTDGSASAPRRPAAPPGGRPPRRGRPGGRRGAASASQHRSAKAGRRSAATMRSAASASGPAVPQSPARRCLARGHRSRQTAANPTKLGRACQYSRDRTPGTAAHAADRSHNAGPAAIRRTNPRRSSLRPPSKRATCPPALPACLRIGSAPEAAASTATLDPTPAKAPTLPRRWPRQPCPTLSGRSPSTTPRDLPVSTSFSTSSGGCRSPSHPPCRRRSLPGAPAPERRGTPHPRCTASRRPPPWAPRRRRSRPTAARCEGTTATSSPRGPSPSRGSPGASGLRGPARSPRRAAPAVSSPWHAIAGSPRAPRGSSTAGWPRAPSAVRGRRGARPGRPAPRPACAMSPPNAPRPRSTRPRWPSKTAPGARGPISARPPQRRRPRRCRHCDRAGVGARAPPSPRPRPLRSRRRRGRPNHPSGRARHVAHRPSCVDEDGLHLCSSPRDIPLATQL
mmetsp:Transcript_122034/g.352641  ORF Transcript_122034/g.352641 Transcript_122034/m.352641 type:complete len:492 (-) Transcript_122034:1-1476(-)